VKGFVSSLLFFEEETTVK